MQPFASRFRVIAILTTLLTTWSAFADNYRLNTVAEKLNFPWSIEFLPNGDRLVAELAGNLRRIAPDGTMGPAIEGVPEVYRESQGGLFDVLMHPQFSQNNIIYLSYAAGDKDRNATTVARARLTQNSLADVEVIFTAAPHKYAPLHYGGRLAWMRDGTLLLTVGDGFDFREQAQNLGTHFGKTIRMQVDGSPARDNPFPETPYVWTYGHRNPQGLAVSRSGVVFQHEHGPQGGDEVNVLEPGKNYGWPAITYGMDYNGAYVSPFTELAGMEQPQHVWVPSIAPSGLMIYEGALFPAWKNSLFVGALVDMEVRRLELEGTKVINEEPLFSEIGERIRDLREAPDGSIYILTDGSSGKVIQVLPAQ
jgi:glucose/arabinose dehydrogenase